METVRRELALGRGTRPEIVVHAGGDLRDRRAADGVAPLVAQSAGQVHIADRAIAHLLHGVLQRRRRPALRTLLHDAIVLARRGHNLFRLEDIVRARFLDVHVLAGLAGPDGHQGVPVVGRGDRDRVNRFVFEQFPKVGVNLRLLPFGFLDEGGALFQILLVDVANGRNLHVGQPAVARDVVPAAAMTSGGLGFADADKAKPYRVAGAAEGARCGAKSRCGTHQKMSSIHRIYRLMPTLSHSERRGSPENGIESVKTRHR